VKPVPPPGAAARPTPASVKPATPPAVKPAPTFAMGPPGETPEGQLTRFQALLERLEKATHYEALGVDRKTATAADVKRSFVLLARDLHPDTVTDPAQGELRSIKERLFARVNEAAQVLGDDARRKEYEKELEGDKKEVDVGRIFDAEDKFARAEILIKARKYKEGLQVLDEAIVLNPAEAEFYAWRGYARFLLAQDRKAAFEDCASEIRKAIKMLDRCVPAYLFLGQMQKVIGDAKGASASFQKVLQLDDRNVEAQRELRMLGKR
jgi:tetratricopeptide (TPR) repeat protein